MKNIEATIILATGYAIIYNLLPFWGYGEDIIVAGFLLSPFVLAFTVWKILRKGIPSNRKWDDYFYDDYPYHRNGKEEMGCG